MLTAKNIPRQALLCCEYLGRWEVGGKQGDDAVLMTDEFSAGLPFAGVLAGYLESGLWQCDTLRYDGRIGAYEAYLRSTENDASVWLRSQLNAPKPQGNTQAPHNPKCQCMLCEVTREVLRDLQDDWDR